MGVPLRVTLHVAHVAHVTFDVDRASMSPIERIEVRSLKGKYNSEKPQPAVKHPELRSPNSWT